MPSLLEPRPQQKNRLANYGDTTNDIILEQVFDIATVTPIPYSHEIDASLDYTQNTITFTLSSKGIRAAYTWVGLPKPGSFFRVANRLEVLIGTTLNGYEKSTWYHRFSDIRAIMEIANTNYKEGDYYVRPLMVSGILNGKTHVLKLVLKPCLTPDQALAIGMLMQGMVEGNQLKFLHDHKLFDHFEPVQVNTR